MTPEEEKVIESSLAVSRATAAWSEAVAKEEEAARARGELFQKRCNAETIHNNARRALLRSQP